MRTKALFGVGVFTTVSALAPAAWADDGPSAMPALPPPSSASTAPGATAPPPNAPIVITASSAPSCRLGEHNGVDEGDARTAAQVVCAEISRNGPPPGASYRVDLGRLGSVVVLTVSREAGLPGSTATSREVQLHAVEDVPVVAPKVAASLVGETPLDDSEIAALTAKSVPRGGSRVHFALGFVGQFPPFDRSITPAPGIDLELHSELDAFQIVGAFRFGAESDDNDVGVDFVDFSMGGRYFPVDSDVAAYLGAGFAWSYLNVSDNLHHDFSGSHAGLGVYGELGVEFLHQHHTHLALGARVDVPFYSLSNDDSSPTAGLPPSIYYAPLSIELRVTF
ncbi:MAG TPA: hypothetical protein VHV30_07445 [Polyangiaceae bacterium]|jgi:hypothetical protein|nr:hypothetical protein [Polyangiaceae bacterium]